MLYIHYYCGFYFCRTDNPMKNTNCGYHSLIFYFVGYQIFLSFFSPKLLVLDSLREVKKLKSETSEVVRKKNEAILDLHIMCTFFGKI